MKQYEIEVNGVVPDILLKYLGGMVTFRTTRGTCQITILRGLLRDQSEFLGILNTIGDHNFEVLSAKSIESSKISLD